MAEKNCEILLEYLRSILYDAKITVLDIERLDAEFHDLGRGLRFLHTLVEEMLVYSAELSKGNLAVTKPEKDNFLCTNLKNLHATLNHLTWQTQQVASGDYSQRVSYLGEFSKAINTMTSQLKDREEKLKQETEIIKHRSEATLNYNELLIQMTSNLNELILVVDKETKDIVYCNKDIPFENIFDFISLDENEQKNLLKNKILDWNTDQPDVREIHVPNNKYFKINSYKLEWHERKAYVHVITDITRDKLEKHSLSNKAYIDPVTSVHNRLFFEEYMDEVLTDKKLITLAYLDLDGLKYVNDNFGHSEGDSYIMSFATTLRKNFRRDDVFARIGGDEFCLVLEGNRAELTTSKLENVREILIKSNDKPYPVSFSYGVHEIDCSEDGLTLDAIMQKADAQMYEYKRENKRNRK